MGTIKSVEKIHKCCADFTAACQEGTDNEMYGSLVSTHTMDYKIFMGCGLKPIAFCPWCGVKVPNIKKEIE